MHNSAFSNFLLQLHTETTTAYHHTIVYLLQKTLRIAILSHHPPLYVGHWSFLIWGILTKAHLLTQ